MTSTYCDKCEFTTVYTTTYVDVCPTGTTENVYTITETCTGDTATWTPPSTCPPGFTVIEEICTACEGDPTVTVTKPNVYTTAYTTTYVDVCPTGTTENVYTITETCTGDSSTYAPPTSCPTDFTVTEKICTACEGSPTVTVTVPVTSPSVYTTTYTVGPANPTGPNNVTMPISMASTTAPVGPPSGTPYISAANRSIIDYVGAFAAMTMALLAGLMFIL